MVSQAYFVKANEWMARDTLTLIYLTKMPEQMQFHNTSPRNEEA